MNNAFLLIAVWLFFSCSSPDAVDQAKVNVISVVETDGLISFWDFHHAESNIWISYHDPELPVRTYPLHLKRIGDPKRYGIENWPYQDVNAKLIFDKSGPFGKAVRFNKGYIYGAVERKDFHKTLLDINGKAPFTIIAWVKFIDKRHMVAGIWDEGGWNKYGGRRQVALFAGLFDQLGVISHVSATGAASYPQSTVPGAQYARCRAIDGMPIMDNQWVAMATTYTPNKGIVTAYLNGIMTPLQMTDPVAQDVYQYKDKQAANPYTFSLPIYSPRTFVLKYNGYSLKKNGISEHRLHVDLAARTLIYMQDKPTAKAAQAFRLFFDIKRQGKSILANPIEVKGVHAQRAAISADTNIMTNDEVWTRLETRQNGKWKQVGTVVKREVLEGAPFTFGRALGLGSGDLEHGSNLYIDGVAVFNRILKGEELKKLSFNRFGE